MSGEVKEEKCHDCVGQESPEKTKILYYKKQTTGGILE